MPLSSDNENDVQWLKDARMIPVQSIPIDRSIMKPVNILESSCQPDSQYRLKSATVTNRNFI
jgi:hypothetical protein